MQRLQAPPPLHMEQAAADAALTAVEGGVPSLGLAAAGDTEAMSREELRMELNVAREAAAGALEELRKTQVGMGLRLGGSLFLSRARWWRVGQRALSDTPHAHVRVH
jgi:hypothetical protein